MYCLCFFLHILIVTYDSTHALCYGDCNSEKTVIPGKDVRLNEGKNRSVLANFAWAFEGWVVINQLDKMAEEKTPRS